MHIRFSIIIKLKKAIYNKRKIFINKIDIYINRKVQQFYIDDIRNY